MVWLFSLMGDLQPVWNTEVGVMLTKVLDQKLVKLGFVLCAFQGCCIESGFSAPESQTFSTIRIHDMTC